MDKQLILIADSGSTKADWLILDEGMNEAGRFATRGLNPYFQSREETREALQSSPEYSAIRDKVKAVRFFGAGCSSDEMNRVIEWGIRDAFEGANIRIDHDLTACAYALYRSRPLCATIIGTGSNACFFDGTSLYQEVPSLAYILGDEASGSFLGKKLLAARFYLQLPQDIQADFDREYGLTKEELLKRVYLRPSPNVFLASFVPFILKYREQPMIRSWVTDGFRLFLDNHVVRYKARGIEEVGFVGSIARLFEEELSEVLSESSLSKGLVIQKPIERLAEYHRQYGL